MKSKPLVALLILLAVVLAWRFMPFHFSLDTGPEKEASRTVERIYFGPRRSLAVLPPGSLDERDEIVGLRDGFALDVINSLSSEPRLQVSSPNSSFFFRGQGIAPRVLSERLQARHLVFLELSLPGDELQVTVRVTDARREADVLNEAFSAAAGQFSSLPGKVQDAVMEAMGIPRRSAERELIVDDAWLAYLDGLSALHHREFGPAREALTRAATADENFASAWVGLTRVNLYEPIAPGDAYPERLSIAWEQLNHALALDPRHGRGNSLKSHLLYRNQWAFAEAMEASLIATESSPGDPFVLSVAAAAALSLGDFRQAVEWLGQAIDRDPLNLRLRLSMGHAQEYAGDLDDALSTYRQTLILNPEVPGAGAYRARIKLLQDKPEVALEELEEEPDPFWSRYARILALFALERDDEAKGLLTALIAEDGHRAAYQVAEIQAYRGEPELAFEWLSQALQQRDGGLTEIVGNRFFDSLHGDDRWAELLHKLGLPLLDSVEESD